MNKIEIAKKATSFVVGWGTSKIVKTIIRNNVPTEDMIDQITVTTGSVVLGAMVADASSKYTDAKIDELVSWWKTNVNKEPAEEIPTIHTMG